MPTTAMTSNTPESQAMTLQALYSYTYRSDEGIVTVAAAGYTEPGTGDYYLIPMSISQKTF